MSTLKSQTAQILFGQPDDCAHVLANLADLVVKEVHGSGGYGMLVGPKSTKAEVEAFRAKIIADPGNYIAQPTLALSSMHSDWHANRASRRSGTW